MKKIFFSFAGFTCEIVAPEKQIEYIVKCYKKSPFAQFLVEELSKNKRIDSRLHITIIHSRKNIDSFKLTSNTDMNFTLSCTENIFFLFPVIEQVLRKIFYILFFMNDGFVLHASGVTHTNKAYIFIGQSGAGKSTIMSLLKSNGNFLPFADNNVFILFDKKQKKFFIYKSPFLEWNVSYDNSVSESDLKVEIGGLFILEKYPSNVVLPLPFLNIIQKLVQQVQIPLKNLSKEEIENSRKVVFTFLKQNLKKINKLSFKKDDSVAHFLLDWIENKVI